MRKIVTYLLLLSLFSFSVLGCQPSKPTYSKEKVIESIISLCKEEYNTEPKVWLLGETVWIYLPLPRLINKETQWDKEMTGRINKVAMGASRVVLSMKPRPQFMAVVASDTQEYGIDYTIINCIYDIVKFQLNYISRDEFSRRTVVKVEDNLQTISDTEGAHIKKKEISMGDFIASQIAQRIQEKFTANPRLKEYFKTEKPSVKFESDTFDIYVDIIERAPLLSQAIPVDIQKEVLQIATFVIKAYNFEDFLLVSYENAAFGKKTTVSRLALKEYLK
jgi:hypothetical protein